MLVEWCKRFRLPHSGNMASLREKLVWYSEHEEEWNKQVQDSYLIVPGR
jgi:hypothetical protein